MSKKLDALMDFWAKNNMNILLSGEHGFGKTAVVGNAFNRQGWKWKYFSAATMDPWVDLVGVPKEYTDENGQTYLKLIRPKEFQNDEYDAIFFDEFNRAPKKVRNAVMELIQFKSINGHKFNNLKVVWAAINPHDEEETYDVEKLDPAQIDRFHVLYNVPSVPDRDFFYTKYGIDAGKVAVEWWSALPDEVKKLVSARRLEYALDCFYCGGDIKYLLHDSTNPSKLLLGLHSGSLIDKLKLILADGDTKALKAFLKKDNQFEVAVELMKNDNDTIDDIIPFIDEERLMRLTHDVRGVREFVTNLDNIDKYADMLKAVINAGTLDDKEEIRLRAILSRGVVSGNSGIVIYKPRPQLATATPIESAATIKGYVTSLLNAGSDELLAAYDYLNLNLYQPTNSEYAFDAMCVIFRFIDREKDDMLVTRYTKIIPMLNYLIVYLDAIGVKVNDPSVRNKFNQGNRKLRSTVKVQGFLDTHHKSFVTKPRLM